MRRKLLNIAAVFSLLLCMAVIVLWARSTQGDKWFRDGPRAIAIVTWNGRILLESRVRTVAPYSDSTPNSSRAANEADDRLVVSSSWQHTRMTAGQWVPSATRYGFGDMSVTNWAKNDVGNSQVYQIERGRLQVVPLWCPLLVFLVLPGVWMYRRLTDRRRLVAGLCPACGYDLRATPDRCPECGAVPREPPHNTPMQRTATASSGAVE